MEKTALQKTAEMALPFVKAQAEGKTVEVQLDRNGWTEKTEVSFYPGATYRIKPVPQYRPFTPEEALKHCGREVKPVPGTVLPKGFVIRFVGPNEFANDAGHYFDFEWAVSHTVFADDGTPCGVQV